MGKMKALSQNGLSIHGSSGLLIKRISSTVRVWHDDFRDGDYYITGFQERSQTAGFSQILAIIIKCYVLYCDFWTANEVLIALTGMCCQAYRGRFIRRKRS